MQLSTFATVSPDEQTYAADCDVIVCYGAAKPTDTHLASIIHCVDDEIIAWLKRGERRRRLHGPRTKQTRQPVQGIALG